MARLTADVDSAAAVLVYVGASDCGFATSAEARQHLQRTLAHFRHTAAARGTRLVTVGISLDTKRSRGVQHLQSIGTFDYEFPLGDVSNPGMALFAGESFGLPRTTPQVALIAIPARRGEGIPQAPARVAYRTEGVHELARWAKLGWRVPR